MPSNGRAQHRHLLSMRGFAASATQRPSQPQSILERVLPRSLVPYAQLTRLDKPIGTWLLAPLAAGTLSTTQAAVFLGAQLVAGLGILVQLNEYSIVLGASSLALVFTYPLMKRITFWPQAFLGLTFNWGALLGWAAVQGSCDWLVVLPLYAGGVCWTLVYDTIYAYQDKDDDNMVGIKSTALRFADSPRLWLSGFAAAQVALLALTGWSMDMALPFYTGLGGVAGHLMWQISTVELESRQDCLSKFKSNRDLGAVMFTGILLDKLIA
ncbi:hypothetical protein WJX73_010476 [Symbiochloris irregularis]|uniref:Uncharacterized protein n=1 Tax=Symbiochloris irregularis TaxID=706552 RepID=A0AAW1PNV9_9CHLO